MNSGERFDPSIKRIRYLLQDRNLRQLFFELLVHLLEVLLDLEFLQ
jgi:hypothetical protein